MEKILCKNRNYCDVINQNFLGLKIEYERRTKMSEIIKESGIIVFVGCILMLSTGIVQVFWTLTRRIAEEDGYRAAYFMRKRGILSIVIAILGYILLFFLIFFSGIKNEVIIYDAFMTKWLYAMFFLTLCLFLKRGFMDINVSIELEKLLDDQLREFREEQLREEPERYKKEN